MHSPRQASDLDFPQLDYRDDYQLALRDIVEDYPQVVFGGDFNVTPPDSGPDRAKVWKPAELYAGPELDTPGYAECDQQNHPGTRTGSATHDSGVKLDYIFGSGSLPGRW